MVLDTLIEAKLKSVLEGQGLSSQIDVRNGNVHIEEVHFNEALIEELIAKQTGQVSCCYTEQAAGCVRAGPRRCHPDLPRNLIRRIHRRSEPMPRPVATPQVLPVVIEMIYIRKLDIIIPWTGGELAVIADGVHMLLRRRGVEEVSVDGLEPLIPSRPVPSCSVWAHPSPTSGSCLALLRSLCCPPVPIPTPTLNPIPIHPQTSDGLHRTPPPPPPPPPSPPKGGEGQAPPAL